jgi:hypothetical protein
MMCGGISLLHNARARNFSDKMTERRWTILGNYERRGELALTLVLGWFIKTQMASEYGDGVADGALAGWFGPGSVYFAIVLAYVVAGLLVPGPELVDQESPSNRADAQSCERPGPDGDWLAAYLCLSVIAMWCLSVGLVNVWHAPIFFWVIVAAFGIAYYQLAHRSDGSRVLRSKSSSRERWGAWLGLVYGLGLSLRKALKGGANLYVGNEDAWDNFFWNWVSLGMLGCLVVGMFRVLKRPKQQDAAGDVFPKAYGIIWLVLIAENLLAQVVTGPLWGPRASWYEFAFSLLYIILFLLTTVIVFHYNWFFRLTHR